MSLTPTQALPWSYSFTTADSSFCLAVWLPNGTPVTLDTISTEPIVMRQYFSHLNKSSSLEPDGMSLLLIKLFNRFLNNRVITKNVFFYHDIGNFRTVNNTFPISKLFGTIICVAIDAYCLKIGFKSRDLVLFANLFFFKSWTSAVANVYFDCSKAFDKVSHPKRLTKLSA